MHAWSRRRGVGDSGIGLAIAEVLVDEDASVTFP